MNFNPAPAIVMHVDINSCFATIEQQANPLLRGRPVVVAAYAKDYGCILTASIEAKRLGVKTGMRVSEGKLLAPYLVVLAPDPPKYRAVNKKLFILLSSYTPDISVESIDEMVLQIPNLPAGRQVHNTAKEIKQRIKNEIGEWITVSIGISTNRYLAKVASGLQKPDGLVVITKENIIQTLGSMELEDLCGIKEGMGGRLRSAGIYTPLAFYHASAKDLERAFHSIVGQQWWSRLHGYEDNSIYKSFDIQKNIQKSFGQSYVLSKPYEPNNPKLWQILSQLVMKMGRRMRKDGFVAHGVGISLLFADHTHWHTQTKYHQTLFTDADFYQAMRLFLQTAPPKPVKLLQNHCYDLVLSTSWQPSLFDGDNKKHAVTHAVDAICDRFGDFTMYSGRMLAMEQKVLDRIAFGKAGV